MNLTGGDRGPREKKPGRHVACSGLGDWEPCGFAVVVREGKRAIIWMGRGFQAERMASAKALRLAGT